MNTRQDYIAVLDSGLGGLSVLRHLRRLLPGERFIYYGDSANAPYGTRSPGRSRRRCRSTLSPPRPESKTAI